MSLDDFDRPLNKRGKKAAPMMAKAMKKRGVAPEIILTSPAKRALRTAEIFAETLHSPLREVPEIYEASPSTLHRIIRKAFENHDRVMLVGHNPSLSFLADELLKDTVIDNIPTAGIVAMRFAPGAYDKAEKLLFFETPRKLERD